MTTAEHNLFQAQLLIEELRRDGVTKFVVCPGARSSPLALALALTDGVECVVHHDERGAGYFAVGYTRATGRAAAVVTTSGTAAVNLHPAIVEASQDNLSLIALTADRPPELHGRSVNQTIDQQNLFGCYVRRFANLPCPDEQDPIDLLHAVDHVFDPAVPGPVHINCMYREPLVPPPGAVTAFRQVIEEEYPKLKGWLDSLAPFHRGATPVDRADQDWGEITRDLRTARRGLLLVGHLCSRAEQRAVSALIARLGWPTIVDVTSGLSAAREPLIAAHHDLILASKRFAHAQAPDTILHVGGRLTSKRLLQFIEASRPAHYIFNAGHNLGYDPVGAVTQRTTVDTAAFCMRLADAIDPVPIDTAWHNVWRTAVETARRIVAGRDDGQPLTEPTLAFTVSQLIPEDTGLFTASSMPIRDLDMFATFRQNLPVAANRGASGIDGTIASACGFADGLQLPVTLLIGDQAFLHDLSSLPLLKAVRRPVTIIVINNRGGRIFESLPVSAHHDALEKFFVHRHSLTFEKMAETFGISYAHSTTTASFRDAYAKMSSSNEPSLLEVAVDPAVSREHRNGLVRQVETALESLSQ